MLNRYLIWRLFGPDCNSWSKYNKRISIDFNRLEAFSIDLLIPNKKKKVNTHLYNALCRMLLILLLTPLTLQFWDHSFMSFIIVAYLTMQAGGFIFKRMYIPTYQYVVYENDYNKKMPTVFSWVMLTLVLFVSIISGLILFFQGYKVFYIFFMPFFFFMGAFCRNLVIYTFTETRKYHAGD